MSKNTWFSWSSGKDSLWALSRLLHDKQYEVSAIFTSINESFNRVSMHSVRLSLLKIQARNLGLPLKLIRLPFPCSNKAYEGIMKAFIEEAKNDDVEFFGFGDLYLEDIRKYRIKQLLGTGIKPIFPLWGENTHHLSLQMVEQGVRSVITCVDEKQLPREFCGRIFDKDFLRKLPCEVDPCGENGEFHSFVFDCPLFPGKIPFHFGKQVSRDGFTFQDIF
ncbi:MAG: ATP-binding protein [Oligoflexales bacterium]